MATLLTFMQHGVFVDKKNENMPKKFAKKQSGQGGRGPSKLPPTPSNPLQTLLIWVVIFGAIFMLLKTFPAAGNRKVELQYNQFEALLTLKKEGGSVDSVSVDSSKTDTAKTQNVVPMGSVIESALITYVGERRGKLEGKVVDASYLEKVVKGEKEVKSEHFVVNIPLVDSDLLARWDAAGFNYSFKEDQKFWSNLLVTFLPLLLLLVLMFFLFRNLQGGQKGVFNFGKSRAKLQKGDKPTNTFADVAGVDEAKRELEEVVDFLKNPEKYRKLGGKIPKGVLLLGQPGTGKTLLARAVAGEAKVPFFTMSGSDFVEMFVGVGASRVRSLFEEAKKNSPCIIFIDEIDAVGRQRGAGLGGGHDEREQTLNQMLVEMDGFEANSGVILVAATNRPDVLDPALLRPGRFDRQVVVDAPDVKGREGILTVHTSNVPLSDDVNLKIIAKGTSGFVGADLANLVNEAALLAARFNQSKVTMLDFEEARDKIIMGTERNSMVMSEEEKRSTAFHEAGHAIATLFCEEADELHKVTIIPRGRALGVTFSLPGEDRHSYSKQYMLDRICVLMGGRVAEKMVFNTMTTGASNDIKQATEMAHRMVCDFGMSDLGPVALGKNDEQVFLGREISRSRDFSEKTSERVDELVRSIIEEQEKRCFQLLEKHRLELNALAEALIDHEHLDKEEIDKVIAGEKLSQVKKSRMTEMFIANRAEARNATAKKNETLDNKEELKPKSNSAEEVDA